MQILRKDFSLPSPPAPPTKLFITGRVHTAVDLDWPAVSARNLREVCFRAHTVSLDMCGFECSFASARLSLVAWLGFSLHMCLCLRAPA